MAKRQTNVMCGCSGDQKDILRDVLRDNLSPEGVAGIAACLVGTDIRMIRKPGPRAEVEWFRDFLIEMVQPEYSDLIEELGL